MIHHEGNAIIQYKNVCEEIRTNVFKSHYEILDMQKLMMPIILVLLLVPIANADFHNTRKAVIDSTLMTEVGLEDVKGPMTATISFFPKTMEEIFAIGAW